ncbi:hypothetical protein KEM56_004427 [Ascosphaera pollenicola]|nr:hypothetical protein KEM56_004427 [Ascosphaera pollenicola]
MANPRPGTSFVNPSDQASRIYRRPSEEQFHGEYCHWQENFLKNKSSSQKYFDSQKYSDITIRTSKRRIKAHKIILAMKSPWFREGFEREPEAFGYMNLTSEDPDVVEAALRFIYDVEMPIGNGVGTDITDPIVFCIKLTTLAETWGLSALVTSVRAAFMGFSRCLWDGKNGAVSTAVIRVLYDAPYTKELVALRKIMLEDCLNRLPALMDQEVFVKVIKEVPDFAVDLLKVRAGREDLTSRKRSSSLN